MGEARSTPNQPSVSVLLDQRIGPFPGGRMQIWHCLSNFQLWPEILPDLQAAKHLHDGELGRGSKLELQWNAGTEIWEICHWHPGQQLDLLGSSSGTRVGWRLNIEATDNAQYYVLESALEFEFKGIWLILAPIATWLNSNRIKRRSQALFSGLDRLQANT